MSPRCIELAWLAVAACAMGCACPSESVTVEGDAARIELCVDVAETEEARARGLMGREPLDEGEGLLIAFPVEQEICIWNRGVGFAIDVLYASADGEVVGIERGVAAGDETTRCHTPVALVLETSAGALDGVDLGSRLVRRE